MIFLDVKQYCHTCIYFEADVDKPFKVLPVKNKDTFVRCKHRDICEQMRQKFSHPNEEDLE